ncbi:IS701 family transposase [Streptomyces mobaraensis]|uniref:IS701 family transposase n=1 Tax=Streptomyces mobaraensis TaxID=35621 RepID=UPI0033F3384D
MSGAAIAVRSGAERGARSVAVPAAGTRARFRARAQTQTQDDVLAELCRVALATLARSDQRRHGEAYLRGLLRARGRKSIRNIAGLAGGAAPEQSLHHFVSSSPWDWRPMRQALAHHLVRTLAPQAWVVRPMVIPKAGENSVGVERRFFREAGQVLNAQQAVGVWAASAYRSAPVNWRLMLSEGWLGDPVRRGQAAIPDAVRTETPGECAVEAYAGMMRDWGLPVRPLVLDAREPDALSALHRLRACGVPVLARVSGSLRVAVADSPLSGRETRMSPASLVMAGARELRRPVIWRHDPDSDALGTSLTAGVRVGLPVPQGGAGRGRLREMLLVGMGENADRWPDELWLTDLVNVAPAALVRLSGLLHRVDRDFTSIADRVGIRDFTGRSFGGWHRHATLASVAHAVALLSPPAGPTDPTDPAGDGPHLPGPGASSAPGAGRRGM